MNQLTRANSSEEETRNVLDNIWMMHQRATDQMSLSQLVGSGIKFPSSFIAGMYCAYAPGIARLVAALQTKLLNDPSMEQDATSEKSFSPKGA